MLLVPARHRLVPIVCPWDWPIFQDLPWTNGSQLNKWNRQILQVILEPTQKIQPLGGGFDDLLFVLEDLASVLFHEHTDRFPHAPTRCPQHLQAIDAGHE